MQQVHDQAVEIISSALFQDSINRFQNNNEQQNQIPPPFMVALGSLAGAGKTSLCKKLGETFSTPKSKSFIVTKNNNDLAEILVEISSVYVLPMDGYHRYRSELSAMPDPEEAFRRRGAPFTFNDEKYAANMEQLRKTGKLNAPAFDHAKKDPDEEFYKVDVKTEIVIRQEEDEKTTTIIKRPLVIVEGIYCLYDDGDFWRHALNQFDLKIYLKIDIDKAVERLTKRHMRVWGIPEADARFRASGSDRDNGLLVIARAELLIKEGKCIVLESVEDEEFAAKTLSS
jgi:pantothenate kinase